LDFNLTPDEQELQQRVRTLAREQIAPLAAEVDETNQVSPELMRILAGADLLRYTVPRDFGGYGIRVMDLCIIREELAQVCGQADTNFIMQGLGSYPITLGVHQSKRHAICHR
jgi:alkylation response protein AidB-like acyl-CoA dehydrogenase